MFPLTEPSSHNSQRLLLRARLVLPVSQAPIEDGAVLISGNHIARLGKWREFSKRATNAKLADLGDSILLPGLINAHCHLDYTDMAGLIPPQRSFVDWIKLMLAAKAEWNYSEFAASWLNGARMLLQSGTTTVGDFEAVPELLPDVWSATPLRVISFIEMTGVRSRRNPRAVLRETLQHIESLPPDRSKAGLAPHAPYSTTPELLRLTAEAARERSLPISIHLAESNQEFEMLKHGRGEMFHWLKRNERDMSDCGLGTPVQHLDRCRILGRNLLAVHVNCLARNDAALLARRNVSVAHCPRSHAYFRHDRFPWQTLSRANVNVCLGTDSLATVYKRPRQKVELSMFDEMRAFAEEHPQASPRTILRMASVNGARALGMAGEVGEISKGAFADLIAIPFSGKAREAFEATVHFRGTVEASMINGAWVVGSKM